MESPRVDTGGASRRTLPHTSEFREREKWPWLSLSLLVALGLVFIAAPLPMGANRIWGWTGLESMVLVLSLVWCLSCPDNRALLPFKRNDPILLGMAAWLLYLVLYLVPLPLSLLQILSPGVHAGYIQTYDVSGHPDAFAYLTFDRFLSMQSLLKQVTYLTSFALLVALVTSRQRLRFVLWILMLAGVVQVAIALISRNMGIDLVPRGLLDGHWDILRGTFVNRNHFAAFLAMATAAGIGLSLTYLNRKRSTSNVRQRIRVLMEQVSVPIVVVGAGVSLIGVGMILSTSRGGVLALMGGLATVLMLSLIARGWKSRELFLVWPLAAAAIAGLVWAGSRELISRLVSTGFVPEERWLQWTATGELIEDFWLTGVGPGVYQYGFAAYKSNDFRPLLYDHAHNDYLQLFAEQGIIGLLLLSALVVIIVQRLVRAFVQRKDIVIRGALFASLTGMTAMLIHGLVEFNFQIPSNALYFWVLAGMGIAAARLPHEGSSGRRLRSKSWVANRQ